MGSEIPVFFSLLSWSLKTADAQVIQQSHKWKVWCGMWYQANDAAVAGKWQTETSSNLHILCDFVFSRAMFSEVDSKRRRKEYERVIQRLDMSYDFLPVFVDLSGSEFDGWFFRNGLCLILNMDLTVRWRLWGVKSCRRWTLHGWWILDNEFEIVAYHRLPISTGVWNDIQTMQIYVCWVICP